jgi:hypothetical protein
MGDKIQSEAGQNGTHQNGSDDISSASSSAAATGKYSVSRQYRDDSQTGQGAGNQQLPILLLRNRGFIAPGRLPISPQTRRDFKLRSVASGRIEIAGADPG